MNFAIVFFFAFMVAAAIVHRPRRGGKVMGLAKHARRKVPLRSPRATPGDDRDYSAEELEFLQAIDRYKRENRKPWPTWGEVLAVARSLGYRKS